MYVHTSCDEENPNREKWPGLGHTISDALYTSLLYDVVIDAEMMKMAAIKAIM